MNHTGFSTVLVTGATNGLGRAAALLLAQEGYRVFAGGRNAERRAALEGEARKRNLPLEVIEMDVCDDASVSRAVDSACSKTAGLDVLINNAGIGIVAPMEEITNEDLRRQFETNFFGVVRVTQRVLPEMRRRGRGRIINMSSIAGRVANPLFGPYSGSKFALEAVSDALRLELAPFGIDVVLIEPGYIPSGIEDASRELSAAYSGKAETSPYASVYRGFFNAWKQTASQASDTPEDCARVILRAVRAPRPKPRYTVTREARLASLLKRFTPDRWLDGMLLRRFGLSRPRR